MSGMSKTTLEKYVQQHGQTETAKRAGLTQGAIWQMLRAERRINVDEIDEYTIVLEETKLIPRRTERASA